MMAAYWVQHLLNNIYLTFCWKYDGSLLGAGPFKQHLTFCWKYDGSPLGAGPFKQHLFNILLEI